jgi:hypothetical protein
LAAAHQAGGGKFWYETDTGQIFYDDGAAWHGPLGTPAANSITNAMLQANSVNSANIVDGTIVTADLSDNSVTSAKIADGTIATVDLADSSVTAAKLQTAIPQFHQIGTHAARPAANAVFNGTLYYETDTSTLFRSDGVSTWVNITTPPPVYPGTELDYVQITTGVTVNVGLGAEMVIITGTSRVYDGTPVKLTFFSPAVGGTPNDCCFIQLWDGGTQLTTLANVYAAGGTSGNQMYVPVNAEFCFTPSAGTHQYVIRARRNDYPMQISAGPGTMTGSGFVPAFLRIVKR